MAEQKAFTYDASGKKETAPMPFMGDKCFLCSLEIGESDPRQFYTKNGQMLLGHTGCINKFMANGEVWPEEPKPEPKVDDLGDVRRVSYGNARIIFTARHLALAGDDLILQHGLKKVIPDIIVALRAVEEQL